jgi:ABC-2 type transport system permease protein
MTSAILWTLIRKDLAFSRLLIVGAIIGAACAFLIANFGKAGAATANVLLLTVLAAHGVIVCMFYVVGERREKTLLFTLSLPVSPAQIFAAKVVAMLLSYLAPWAFVLVGGIVQVLASALPNGLIPFVVMVCMLLLANFSVVLAVSMLARTEFPLIAAILATNLAITVFMMSLGTIGTIEKDLGAAAPVWSADVLVILLAEAAVIAIAFSTLFYAQRRNPYLP